MCWESLMWGGERTMKGISWKTEQLHERWSADVLTLVIYPSACLRFVTVGLISISKEDRDVILWSHSHRYVIIGSELKATCCCVCSLKTAMFPVLTALWVVADDTEKQYFSVCVYRRRQILLKPWWPATRACFVVSRNLTV